MSKARLVLEPRFEHNNRNEQLFVGKFYEDGVLTMQCSFYRKMEKPGYETEDITYDWRKQMVKLFLLRGIPGSGKSTRAAKFPTLNLEADQFFIKGDDYTFNHKLLGMAHDWCFGKAARRLFNGESVVVSNTFTQEWELKRYLDMAELVGVEVEVIHCKGEFQNTHGVPDDKVQQMKHRFVPNETLAKKYPNVTFSEYIPNDANN